MATSKSWVEDTLKLSIRIRNKENWSTLNMSWLMPQKWWSKTFRNCWSSGIFLHSHIWGLQKMVQKDSKYPWVVGVRAKMPVYVSRQGTLGRMVGDNRINHMLKPFMQNTVSEPMMYRTLEQQKTPPVSSSVTYNLESSETTLTSSQNMT